MLNLYQTFRNIIMSLLSIPSNADKKNTAFGLTILCGIVCDWVSSLL